MNEIPVLPQPIDRLRLEELNTILGKYKAGKARLDTRVKSAENWWMMRNLFEEQKTTDPKNTGFRAATAWLHNTIAQKQAAAMEAYPEAMIYPHEQGDEGEAWALKIIATNSKFFHLHSE